LRKSGREPLGQWVGLDVGPAAGAVIAAAVYELLYLKQPATDTAAPAA
jgi:hypothetical protein